MPARDRRAPVSELDCPATIRCGEREPEWVVGCFGDVGGRRSDLLRDGWRCVQGDLESCSTQDTRNRDSAARPEPGVRRHVRTRPAPVKWAFQ